MSSQYPTVGRIVHYFAYGTPGGEYPAGVPRAAIITEVVNATVVGLCVLNPTGQFFNRDVTQGQKAGCWDWPVIVARETVQTPPVLF